jgi:PD-(D/E)XK nuclease superfamily
VGHKALELWALDKRRGSLIRQARRLIEEASTVLGLTVPASQAAKATTSVELVVQRLDGWTPLLSEAPFTMDLGSGNDSLLVYGFLDLLARDDGQKLCLVDYKSGGALGTKFELQLGLYRMAARDVYGLEVGRCFIGRVAEDNFAFESIGPASDDEVRAAIVQTRDGFIRRDTTPKAGAWCGACAYRAAPCMDYQKRSQTRAV